MKSLLSNPYLAILLTPLAVFLTLIFSNVPPDPISLVSRMFVFGLLAYVSARYVGRAPLLVYKGDMSPEARNIVGWALLLVAMMGTQVYGWLYIWYDRPVWLSSQYWSPSFVILSGVGLTLVASSVPRFPPFGNGPHGLSVAASFIVGFSSAMFLFFASHIGQVIAMIKSLWFGTLHAL